MSKTNKDLDCCNSPVGVVMRGDAPMVERLLAEQDDCNYLIAIDELDAPSDRTRKWLPLAGVGFIVSLLSLLDPR